MTSVLGEGLTARRSSRWLAAFVGYPIGGLAGAAVTSLVGAGQLGGALGAGVAVGIIATAQRAALGRLGDRDAVIGWVGASTLAGAIGWLIARTILPTSDGALDAAIVGGVSGLAIGIAQAVASGARSATRAVWAATFMVAWALGNAISSSIGVDTASWPVFGASGAIAAQATLLGSLWLVSRPSVRPIGQVAR